MKKVVCFGEVLWDMLPSGKVAGGAPMNVAFQAKNLGLDVKMISRVGIDPLGEELVTFLTKQKIPTQLVQEDQEHRTGVVQVSLSDKGQPSYDIVQPVAWDFIEQRPELISAVELADLFVFGSLAARSEVSRETLLNLLDVASFRAFDVNFRAPFFSESLITELLIKSDLVKVNDEELEILAAWYGIQGDQHQQLRQLMDKFHWKGIICTLGADGAMFIGEGGVAKQGGFSVDVQDTIGSGDAFFATFIWSMLSGEQPDESLKKGAAAGALIASKKGATFPLNPSLILDFIASGS